MLHMVGEYALVINITQHTAHIRRHHHVEHGCIIFFLCYILWSQHLYDALAFGGFAEVK